MKYRDKEACVMSRQISSMVRALRKLNKKTQPDLASEMGMCISTYCPMELGYKEWSLYRIQKVCQIFNITVLELFTMASRVDPVKTKHSV
jgi:transcriptional regulator with XRE-family HTH domain